MAAALRTKAKYHSITGAALSFVAQVDSDPEYSWCCPTVLKPVKDAQDALAAQLDDFARNLLSGASSQELKKSYAERDLETKLKAVPELEPLLQKLQSSVQMLMRMHSVRSAK